MKYVVIVLRSLLGLLFLFGGLSYFMHWMEPPPVTADYVKLFMGALIPSGYMDAVKVLEIAGGAILISGFFTPLGLTILGPILVNILFHDLFLAKAANPIVFVAIAIEVILIAYYWPNFRGVFAAVPTHECRKDAV